jgi:predicted phosphoribosyltransferase
LPELHIDSRSDEAFRDRREAGELLGARLSGLWDEHAVVLGIPRGGMVIAHHLARGIDGELDVVLSRKLRTPGYPELAMGSVAETGQVFLNEDVLRGLDIREADIEAEKQAQLAEIARRSDLIRENAPRIPLGGRTVVVTDDGVATGATMQAALWAARREDPAGLIVALPVASEEALNRLSRDADDTCCLRVPRLFGAVGQFYERFAEVADDEVLRLLKEDRLRGGVQAESPER